MKIYILLDIIMLYYFKEKGKVWVTVTKVFCPDAFCLKAKKE